MARGWARWTVRTEASSSPVGLVTGELFTCFFYDNPGFIVTPSSRHEEVSAVVQKAVDRGVELWQINLPLTPDGIRHPTTRRLVF